MIKDKVCVITGAASGIGLSIAKEFAAAGAKVVMSDIQEEKLMEESAKIKGLPLLTDLSKREDCKALIDFAVQKYGTVDILINGAGIQTVTPIEDFPEDKWDFMIALMLTAPFLLTKYAWPYMKKQHYGRIIHINSIHGIIASEFKSAYVTAKHGLTGLTRVSALEGGEHNITVNSICPSYVKTPLVDNQIAAQAKNHGISEERVVKEVMLQKAVIKTLIEPESIAEIAKFLCGNAAAHITGSNLSVDGGWTIN